MTITRSHTNACFDAWIHCEDLLSSIAGLRNQLSKKVSKTVDECALICMGTFHAIKSYSANIQKMALLCVGICEECADVCESMEGESFRQCANTCRKCSEILADIAFAS